MKTVGRIGLFALLLTLSLGAMTAAQAAPEIGQLQGKFALELFRAAGADKFEDGAVTAQAAAEQLGKLGFIPSGGWQVDTEFTEANLREAYDHLVETQGVEEEDENLSVEELVDRITELLAQAMETVESSRQAASPTTTRMIGL